MYETLIYTGGVHKSEEIKELIEDLGGFILQDNILQMKKNQKNYWQSLV